MTAEYYPFVLLAVSTQQPLTTTSSLSASSDTVVPVEGEPLLLMAARGALPADIRGLALSVGLNSSLYDAPNSIASAVATLRGAPIAINVVSIIVQMLLMLRSSGMRDVLQMQSAGCMQQFTGGAALPVPAANSVRI